ncbi:MAG: branched-chain amino acid ABC transporter permease [Actinomycetia bacterium]|nr:branched-chain amino acid ABC transporter permease [Actinomycetes bacterium]MCP5033196.1 branched-chain amino acid ABC transporter permease [Actinomycetes bacterium]
MELLLQRIFDAMFNGAIYASLAIALVMIYRATGLLNFAQGELATFSAYFGFLLLSPTGAAVTGVGLISFLPGLPWPVPLAIVGAVVFGAVAGGLTERILIRPLEGRPDVSVVNVTIGLLIAINALTVEFWGTRSRMFPSPFPNEPADFIGIGGARLRIESIGVWLTLLTLLVVLGLFLHRTKVGLAFRAITGNRESAQLCGVRVGRTLMLGWAVAAGIGALAAALVADSVLLEPFMMIRLLIFSFAAATIGGLDSPLGALVGGVIVAMTQTLIPGYVPFIPTELSLLPPLLVMAGVLLIRPTGLFGTKRVERV